MDFSPSRGRGQGHRLSYSCLFPVPLLPVAIFIILYLRHWVPGVSRSLDPAMREVERVSSRAEVTKVMNEEWEFGSPFCVRRYLVFSFSGT